MSVGSRQSRRERRARKRRAKLREIAAARVARLVARIRESVGDVGWGVPFFALLFSLVGAVLSVLYGALVPAGLFSLSSLFLFLALWQRSE